MGHENGADMATNYVERVGDDRLQAVSGRIREWAFQPTPRQSPRSPL
jgi:hypothetical protein